MHDTTPTAPTLIKVESFGKLDDGRETKLYTLSHPNGLKATITDYGATLVSVEAPDRNGELADITHGFDSVAGYTTDKNPYFGASVGRFANRIRSGRFSLEGKDYQLATNNDPGGIPCHLHGGRVGFNRLLWQAEPAADGRSITLSCRSKDGDEGYPGNLDVRITYRLTDDGELIWEATATTDAPTVLNLVHHSYWNLSGDPSTTVYDHELTLHAEHFLPTDEGMIPTGERSPVRGTPMDFTTPHRIGDRIDSDFEALKFGHGYDHCWVLAEPSADTLTLAARLVDPGSGRVMEVLTNQPGIQFYSGNWVWEDDFSGPHAPGKGGIAYDRRSGCCLETENFPDAPNQPGFPSAVLRPGETYRHVLVHRFSAE